MSVQGKRKIFKVYKEKNKAVYFYLLIASISTLDRLWLITYVTKIFVE